MHSIERIPQSVDSATASPEEKRGFISEWKETDRTPSMETNLHHAAKESPRSGCKPFPRPRWDGICGAPNMSWDAFDFLDEDSISMRPEMENIHFFQRQRSLS
jgi:hypothetical protein